MAITTVLFAALALTRWHWGVARVVVVAGVFLMADLAFVGANALKFSEGGWLPVLLGAGVFLVMSSWRHGRLQLAAARLGSGLTPEELVSSLQASPPHRVEGTAVFLSERSQEVPTVLTHHLKHNQVLHERVVLLTLETVDAPRVADAARLTCQDLGLGFLRVVARYGFMESPNVPALLHQASRVRGEDLYDPMRTSFYLGRATLTVPTGRRWLRHALLNVFLWQRRNELDATAHFGLPANRVVEMGARLQFRPDV
jgi:KUP system potassium uptake protein